MDENEFAWRMYQSERSFIEHHENQRTNASSILAAISAALTVAVCSDVVTGLAEIIVAVALTLVGVFGAIFSGKLYELIQLHAGRSYHYLDILDQAFPSVDVEACKSEVKKAQKSKFPYFSGISLNKIWFRFHILVAVMGFSITIATILRYLE